MKNKIYLYGIVMTVLIAGLLGYMKNTAVADDSGDEMVARLLVKLELRTRGVIAKHFIKADISHREWLAKNSLLAGVVADKIYYEIVPEVTNGRAWVKMVVDNPRNPHNIADETSKEILKEIKTGKSNVSQRTEDAFYYAEPIKAMATCLQCHGSPKGSPDPFFPKYTMNGWKSGEIIGAVIARVAK